MFESCIKASRDGLCRYKLINPEEKFQSLLILQENSKASCEGWYWVFATPRETSHDSKCCFSSPQPISTCTLVNTHPQHPETFTLVIYCFVRKCVSFDSWSIWLSLSCHRGFLSSLYFAGFPAGQGDGAAHAAHQAKQGTTFGYASLKLQCWQTTLLILSMVHRKGINQEHRRGGSSAPLPQQVLTDSSHLWDFGQEENEI